LARAYRSLQPARRAPFGAGRDRDHDRRDDRAVVRRPKFAATRVSSIRWVVVRTFLRRA
jgi:hypothetical protein